MRGRSGGGLARALESARALERRGLDGRVGDAGVRVGARGEESESPLRSEPGLEVVQRGGPVTGLLEPSREGQVVLAREEGGVAAELVGGAARGAV